MKNVNEQIENIKNELLDEINDEFEELTEEISEHIETKNSIKKGEKKHKSKTTLTLFTVACSLFILCISLLIASIAIKGNAAKEAYDTAKNSADNQAYNDTKSKIIDAGKDRYKVTNDVSITIGEIKSKGDLSVLEFSDVHYYTSGTDSLFKQDVCYKISGTAKYLVNMRLSEIIVDQERKYVLIRIPEPVFSENIDYETERFYVEDSIFKSISDGAKISQDVEKNAYPELQRKLRSNTKYFEYAKINAKETLIEEVKKYNPNLEIEVEVEFF